MISVLTLTYKRPHFLEEAIESFLAQELPPESEMVVINDNAEVDYVFDHPRVRIINHKERFPSISAKIKWGYQQCKYDHIYRLDDDDLLAPWGLKNASIDIETNPGYDVYRSEGMYFFVNNIFDHILFKIIILILKKREFMTKNIQLFIKFLLLKTFVFGMKSLIARNFWS